MIGEIVNHAGFSVETARLNIMPAKGRDAKYYFQEFNENVTRYQFPEPFDTLRDARRFLREFTLFRYLGVHLVSNILTKDGVFVGSIELSDLDTRRPGIGIWICEQYQGRGYAYEALVGIMYFMRCHMYIEWFTYEVDKRNIASVQLVHKLGGEWKSYREARSDGGKTLELDCYHIR